ncbi:sugar phosphate isomerase/epimerase [Intestinibacillus massiliensis]|nr:sugar phosphate isomerase/epimerase [Intestinibacillus massiliensis]
MELGISTACFYPKPLEQAAYEAAQMGVSNAEVFINTESEFRPDYIEALRELLSTHGLRVTSVHPYTSPMEGQMLLSDYARRTEDGMKMYARYFEAARGLGARYFTFHGERSVIRDRDAADIARKVDAYRRLCELAAGQGLVLAQENVAWCKSENPNYLRMLYEQVPELGFTLDLKQAHRAGHHWGEYLDAVGDRVVNVHLNDFDSTRSCLLPGEGAMDYAAFFQRLHALHYSGHLLIEVYASNFADRAQFRRSVEYLEPFVYGRVKAAQPVG